jgi:hypothetical protein
VGVSFIRGPCTVSPSRIVNVIRFAGFFSFVKDLRYARAAPEASVGTNSPYRGELDIARTDSVKCNSCVSRQQKWPLVAVWSTTHQGLLEVEGSVLKALLDALHDSFHHTWVCETDRVLSC